jgi:DNA replication ATP-dependent helicase Dna2
MSTKGTEFLDEVFEVHTANLPIKDRYPRLRTILERACRNLTASEPVQFSNLYARLNYLCQKTQYNRTDTYHIHTLRIHANKVLHADFVPTEEKYLFDLRALCRSLSHFYKVQIPENLISIIPATNPPRTNPPTRRHDNIRVQFLSRDENVITVYCDVLESEIKILVNIDGQNQMFSTTIENLWEGCQLNLLDVTVDNEGNFIPGIIVLEPDYLIDVTSVAENYQEYGSHPLNYIMSRFQRVPNNSAILLGNYCNEVLDHFLTKDQFQVNTYKGILEKVFRNNAFKIATNPEFSDSGNKLRFAKNCEEQFEKIRQTVYTKFTTDNPPINKDAAILEPAFLCEKLGVQGRMDFLQLDYKLLIELKSGKANEFGRDPRVQEKHLVQTHLYLGILQYNTSTQHQLISQKIFYSKYPVLLSEPPNWTKLKHAINLRNLIVANDYKVCSDEAETKHILRDINSQNLNVKNLQGNLWENHVKPRIEEFRRVLDSARNIEKKYFEAFYSFVVRENYFTNTQTSRLGEDTDESYWTDFEKKKDAGEILFDCTIIPERLNLNPQSEEVSASVVFLIPEYPPDILPNFRKGDIVFIYQRNSAKDNATTQQVFKGNIVDISSKEVKIQLRYKQHNVAVFPAESKYAIEHDQVDSSYAVMFQGLYSFLQATENRRNLILGLRSPHFNTTRQLVTAPERETIKEIVQKSLQADDYYLLVGPPGTGKTSQALTSIVKEFMQQEGSTILILSYTNRAVDEICDNIMALSEKPNFIRISSEASCGDKYKPYLLNNTLRECKTIDQVKSVITLNRLFIGTVASVGSQVELFKMKSFTVAIVDEASQILEPSLLSILSAKNGANDNAVEKFILIGDHKQLPAVVIQSSDLSAVNDSELLRIGLKDRRNSLFERLYDLEMRRNGGADIGRLIHQGRMHEDVALFPNHAFYNSSLKLVPRAHQTGSLNFTAVDSSDSNLMQFIAKTRLAFIPSERNISKNLKTNPSEASVVSGIVKCIYSLYSNEFDPNRTVGIITPYRSQIAQIRKELEALGITALQNITIDTVERYQGSERDVIVYSVCANTYDQLENLSMLVLSDGQLVDRKLNVALTRARKQLFITGNSEILSTNLVYYKLIEFIRSKNGYVYASPTDFIQGNFLINSPETSNSIASRSYEPEPKFEAVFERLVISPLMQDGRTQQLDRGVLGRDSDFIRMRLIDYGRADFDQATLEFSANDKVNLYCYFNMRKHYATGLAIFNAFNDFFTHQFNQTQGRITFIDFGCGPLTSGMAFKSHFSQRENFQFSYIGIDISESMRVKAREFADSELFLDRDDVLFADSFASIDTEYFRSAFILSNTVVFNFSYLFGNLNGEQAENLANQINEFVLEYPLNKYLVIYQNSAQEKRNRSYNLFRKRLSSKFQDVTNPKVETVTYKTRSNRSYSNTETVYYEVKST